MFARHHRGLLALIIAILTGGATGCSTAGFKAPRVELGSAEFEHGGMGQQPTVGVGLLFREDQPAGNKVEDVWVGNAALRAGSIDHSGVTGSRIALDLGARLYPRTDSKLYQPYIGLGGTLERYYLDDVASSATVVDPGAYAEVGVDLAFGALRIGLGYRHTAGIGASIDGTHTNLNEGAFLLSIGVGL